MEIMLYSAVFFIAILSIFLVIEKPYKFASIIIFMILYKFNFETPLPLDARGLLLLLLFLRLYFFDKENMNFVNNYLFKNKYFWLLFIFGMLLLIEPIITSKGLLRNMKDIILSMINLIIGFILVKNEEGRKSILYGIILAGIFSSIDLIFNSIVTGTLNIVRLPDLLLGNQVILNHNYPGFLTSMGIIYIYLAWYHTKTNRFVLVITGIFLLLGVFLSTSRSALLATFVTIILMSFIETDLRHNFKKLVQMGIVVIALLVGFFFIYNTFLSQTKENSFVQTIYYRLYEEPLQMFGEKKASFSKWTGQRIKGSMKFRAVRWQDDFEKFTNLGLADQLFGLGPKGYLDISMKIYAKDNNVYEKLAPHNGYLLILLERGIIGLFLFMFIFISISISAFRASKYGNIPLPFIYLIIMVAIYSFAQNSDITSVSSYLIFGSIIGDIIHSKIQPDEEET